VVVVVVVVVVGKEAVVVEVVMVVGDVHSNTPFARCDCSKTLSQCNPRDPQSDSPEFQLANLCRAVHPNASRPPTLTVGSAMRRESCMC
jgi:hypothetical protein